MEKDIDYELKKEYDDFILWRCKEIREECEARAIREGIDMDSIEYRRMLMRESYKIGVIDTVKIYKYIV